ncbi:MAG TPA: 50S ribosomal protein L11 methyltransferase [Burkholderiales bacterium]|jgi:ribosomal protein L11 methyltransferase
MPWRALTLQVEASAAEAMSEALLEAGAQSVSIDKPDAPRATLCALLDPKLDPDACLRAAASSAGLAAAPPYGSAEVADEDWVRKSQAQFEPVEIGERLWIGPGWCPPPVDRVAVRLDPGLAFGTGTHPTTQLVLRFLERAIRGAESVLDYGCGSGILAIAAAKLGAASVDGVDVDEQALATARDNAQLNGVELRPTLPEGLRHGAYEMVVSNILAQPLILLAPVLAARTAPGGKLVLAGILEPQAAEVAAAYTAWLDMRIDSLLDGWALLVGSRR